MSLSEHDISWQVLRRIVQDWAGVAADIAEVKPLVGGAINTTLLLVTKDNGKVVLKISPHRVNADLEREASQLKLLKDLGLPVPTVYNSHLATLDYPHSFLLMEYLEGVDLNVAKRQASPEAFDDLQRHLADLVLSIHAHTAEEYHRPNSNGTPRYPNWVEFYHHIYDPIWRDVAKDPGLPPKYRKQIAKIHDRLDQLLAHSDCPRLVHWDIWATNILAKADADGKWRISGLLDPNCKYAHAEAEIAYLDLFHTITPAFLEQYQQSQRLGDEYHRVRKPIYQLYPLINHVHLFGHDYIKPLLSATERVAALV